VTVGIEAVTDWIPYNTMYEESNVTWTDGSVHTWAEAKAEAEPHLCQGHFSRSVPPTYYPGNIKANNC
jgi:hypothetical protein